MRFKWLLGNFADPQYGLPRAEERELSMQAHKRHMPAWRFTAWSVVTVVTPLLLCYVFVLPYVLGRLGLTGHTPAFTIGVMVIAALSWPLSAWSYGHLHVTAVRKAMRDKGMDVCIGCGYRLDELPAESDRCPECGRRREPMPEATPADDA